MELIVRTAHGTADVSIDVHDRDVSLRDLISTVTGQAAPSTAIVDGRLTDAGETVAACGVVTGSVIDTLLDGFDDGTASSVTVLRQHTGPGAGRRVPLGVGRYRVGPGRRQHASELSSDTTDTVAFDLEVTSSSVIVTPGPQTTAVTTPLLFDGEPLVEPTPWSDQSLTAGARVFRLEQPRAANGRHRATPVEGHLVHNRPPGLDEHDRTIVEAIDDATTRAPRLWHRRTRTEPLRADIGLAPNGSGTESSDGAGCLHPIALELGAGRMVAVTGPAGDRAALARAMVIDICTRYGPADVDLVLAAAPGELGDWDWAKWLPHIRWGAAIDLLTNDLELARLADRALERPTVVIVTNDELWNGPHSPLRSFVLDAPTHAAIIVLTAERNTAPAPTTSIVGLDSQRPGAATLTRLDRSGAEAAMYVPLVDIDVAADVARHLAPLVDPDRLTSSDQVKHLVALDEIVQVEDAATKWDTAQGAPGMSVQMPVGRVADVSIGADFGSDASAVISGSSLDEAIDVATVLALSMTSTWSPAEASLLLIDHRAADAGGALEQLPHHAGTFTERDASSIDRLLDRLRADRTGESPSSTRLIVVVAGIAETELAAPGLIDGLVALAADAIGVHLIVATARPLAVLDPALRAVCPIEIAVDRYGGSRSATLHDRRRKLQTPFTPYDESTTTADALTVRPFVFGRSPSALERRLERGTHADVHNRDHAVERAARRLAALATDRNCPVVRPLLPIPLPPHVRATDLWSAHLGDGVPLGLLGAADADSPVAYWWQPGPDGSRIFIGSPRSGVRSAIEVLLVGIADRFATADLELYVAEHNDRRRHSIAAIPHVIRAASPDHAGAVESMLGEVAAEMRSRLSTPDVRVHDRPSILVIARDVDRLTDAAATALAQLLTDGSEVGINVVAAAQRADGIDDLLDACDAIVVGALTDPDQYVRLGISRAPAVERHAGRVQLSDGTLVQLAELDGPLDNVLDALTSTMEPDA